MSLLKHWTKRVGDDLEKKAIKGIDKTRDYIVQGTQDGGRKLRQGWQEVTKKVADGARQLGKEIAEDVRSVRAGLIDDLAHDTQKVPELQAMVAGLAGLKEQRQGIYTNAINTAVDRGLYDLAEQIAARSGDDLLCYQTFFAIGKPEAAYEFAEKLGNTEMMVGAAGTMLFDEPLHCSGYKGKGDLQYKAVSTLWEQETGFSGKLALVKGVPEEVLVWGIGAKPVIRFYEDAAAQCTPESLGLKYEALSKAQEIASAAGLDGKANALAKRLKTLEQA